MERALLQKLEEIGEELRTMNLRVRKLERGSWFISGAISAMTIGLPVILGFMGK